MGKSLAIDPGPFTQALRLLAERDVKIAATWALNDTADEALSAVQDRMKVVFDRPNAFTQNAFYAKRAASNRLTAAVQQRSTNAGRNYLRVQEEGGPRPRSGFEGTFDRGLAFDAPIQSVIPADEARLDAYGNWSIGQIKQVQSALKIQRDQAANATAVSTARGKRRGRLGYFVPKHGLSPGVYSRSASGQIGIVAAFSQKVPVYQERLGFYETVMKTYEERFAPNLSRTLSKMVGKRFG